MSIPCTLYTHPDEKAYALVEMDLQSPGYKGIRRYQIILVNRDDELTEYRWDMGPANDFPARLFRLPSLWMHTVGELQEMADDLRDTTSKVQEQLPTPDGENMLQKMLDLDEASKAYRKGKRYY